MARKNYREIHVPQFADFRYIVMDGEIFTNTAAKEPKMLAKFIRKTKRSA